jgi:hypothetical protein
MFEKTKLTFQENKDKRIVKAAEAVGGFAIAYAGVYLLQHGLDPNLSKGSTLRVVANNVIKNTPFLRDRGSN